MGNKDVLMKNNELKYVFGDEQRRFADLNYHFVMSYFSISLYKKSYKEIDSRVLDLMLNICLSGIKLMSLPCEYIYSKSYEIPNKIKNKE